MMNKIIAPLSIVLFFFLTVSCREKKKKEKPNILFIFTDDQSFNTINALGNPDISTPNLDKLVSEGTTFTHAYNMGSWSGAVCVASRAMLITGKFVWNTWNEIENLDSLAEAGQLWPQLLKKQGYDTYFAGKWHARIPPDTLFDHKRHVRPGMPGTIPTAYNRPVKGKKSKWSPYDKSLGGFWKGGTHWSEVLAQDAGEFFLLASKDKDPFFMYLSFNAPHDPRQSPKEYVDMYPAETMDVPGNFLPEYPFKNKIGCHENLRDERLAPFPRTKYAVNVHRSEYYALISHMDKQIGKILDALKKSGKSDNTYIFFTSDHGLACGQHGFMGKQNMYDHSIRAPFIVVGPGIPENEKREMNIYLQDVMPTTLSLAGADKPEQVEFTNLLPYIHKINEPDPYKYIYGCYMDRQRMVRDDKYKLIAYPKASILRLYNVKNDPLEVNDLAENPEHEDRVKTMFSKLKELSNQMNDTLKLDNYFEI